MSLLPLPLPLLPLLPLLLLLPAVSVAALSVTVNVSTPLLTLPPAYLGFTLDWWTPGSPEPNFGPVGALYLDLGSPRLRGLAAALGPSTLRLGGSLDSVIQYDLPAGDAAWCGRPITFRGFNYSGGLCLNGTRWAALLDFASAALAPGSRFVFGLQLDLGEQGEGPWNGTAVVAFLNATAQTLFPSASVLYAVEVGEETNPTPGSQGWTALLNAYAGVRAALDAAWPADAPRPRVHGPCSGMTANTPPFTWSSAFVDAAFPSADASGGHTEGGVGGESTMSTSTAVHLVDAFVMHSYNNNGGGGSWAAPGFLNETAQQAAGLRGLLDARPASSGVPLWCGECGPHNGGGIENVTDTAMSSFWYADALFGLPLLGVTSFTRQSLAGGWYGLLKSDGSFDPNPDYFVALAYARLVGPAVLSVSAPGLPVDSLRVYAQCAAAATGADGGGGGGGVVVAWINVDPERSFNISVALGAGGHTGAAAGSRLDYVFAPAGKDARSPVLLLNGLPLSSPGVTPPALVPVQGDAAADIVAAPLSFGLSVYPDAGAPACA